MDPALAALAILYTDEMMAMKKRIHEQVLFKLNLPEIATKQIQDDEMRAKLEAATEVRGSPRRHPRNPADRARFGSSTLQRWSAALRTGPRRSDLRRRVADPRPAPGTANDILATHRDLRGSCAHPTWNRSRCRLPRRQVRDPCGPAVRPSKPTGPTSAPSMQTAC